MSECVVRMEMPEHCGECELQIWDIWPGSFKCAKTRTDIMSHMRNRTKPNDCPILCQLPEGHGRLVDADKLKERSVHFSETGYAFDFDTVFIEDINKASTIVPAEPPAGCFHEGGIYRWY